MFGLPRGHPYWGILIQRLVLGAGMSFIGGCLWRSGIAAGTLSRWQQQVIRVMPHRDGFATLA